MKSDTEKFHFALHAMLTEATTDGLCQLEVNAGKLHRAMGGYPGPKHIMPIVCGVMRREFDKERGDMTVLEPPKRTGASLTIRFALPRKKT